MTNTTKAESFGRICHVLSSNARRCVGENAQSDYLVAVTWYPFALTCSANNENYIRQ